MRTRLSLISVLCLGWCSLFSGCVGAAEPGLVAHWTFDEGHGTVARDVTGHGHDATIKGATWVKSPRGYALRFDGVDDVVSYGNVNTMNLSGDMSLAVWVKTDEAVAPQTNRLIFGDAGMGVQRNLNLRLDGYGYLRFEWADGVRNASLLAPARLLDGTWKQVVVVCNSKALQAVMYVDGKQVAQMRMPLPISKAPVKERISGRFYNGCLKGELDDVRLYDRALTAQEVQALYRSQAAVQVEQTRLVLDPAQPGKRALIVADINNYTNQSHQLSLTPAPAGGTGQMTLPPHSAREMTVGVASLKPLSDRLRDLWLISDTAGPGAITLQAHLGDLDDVQHWTPQVPLYIQPLQLVITDPWQRQMPATPTRQITMQVRTALPAAALSSGQLVVTLTSRETAKQAARHVVKLQVPVTDCNFAVGNLPWGAYEVKASFVNRQGQELAATKGLATILPGGAQRIVVLNNLVSELMNLRARGLLGQRTVEFMNPRHGWCFFSLKGAAQARLDGADTPLLKSDAQGPAAEAMRLLPAGRHTLRLTGQATDLIVRAIPALFYNVYPATPQIRPFGTATWARLKPRTLPNTNMIESQQAGIPEDKEWVAEGKSWIMNRTAPGRTGGKLTVADALKVWHAAPGYGTNLISGMQVDEYSGGWGPDRLLATIRSTIELAAEPAFAGKLWIPFVSRTMYDSDAGMLFMKAVLAQGWPFSIEEYLGEMPTAAEDQQSIQTAFTTVAQGWNGALPGSIRHAIFTPMYSYLPYCATNRLPQADFRVHLQTQLQALATQPGFFGLWGVEPYRSNYVNAQIQDVTAALLRHYCIEGKTDRLLPDPYELTHIANPDFTSGTDKWQINAATPGAVTAGHFPGYGNLEGRYPGGAYGDTFVVLKRSAEKPNVISQEVTGLQAGRLYSLKVISADYQDLTGGKSVKKQMALSVRVEGAQLQPGSFDYPFRSARGPNPFTREHPFWMTYHWLQFRAQSPTAKLAISDWTNDHTPGGPAGQEQIVNFVELQPVYEPK